jgi:hypothetical protein
VKSHVVPAAVLVLALILGGVVVPMSAASGTGKSVRAGGGNSSGARIVGAAWTADNQPVPNANLRLRNVISGKIEATTVANAAGRFTFDGVEGGSYVTELVSDSGRILALGHTFSVAPGETIATFVRLGAKAPWFAGFFSNAAASSVSAASSLGVTALGSSGIPATAQH